MITENSNPLTGHWQKACRCKAASATNRFVVRQETDAKTHALLVVTTFYPMPSCCDCDTPWKWVAPEVEV